MDVLAGIFLLAVMICCPVLFVISGRKTAEDVDNLVEQIQSIHDGELRDSYDTYKVIDSLADSGFKDTADFLSA